jgi:hypothetical protein
MQVSFVLKKINEKIKAKDCQKNKESKSRGQKQAFDSMIASQRDY